MKIATRNLNEHEIEDAALRAMARCICANVKR